MSNELKNELRNEKGQTLSEFLAEYDPSLYEHPSVTVDNIIFADIDGRSAVLLIKRRNHPFIGCWAFPGGFLEKGEDVAEGAARELIEETGVHGVRLRELGVYGRPDRDPRGWIITVAFTARLPEGQLPKAADDAADADLFYVDCDSAADMTGNITLTAKRSATVIKVPYRIRDGRAEFIPAEGIAGDHSQILADALIRLGMIALKDE